MLDVDNAMAPLPPPPLPHQPDRATRRHCMGTLSVRPPAGIENSLSDPSQLPPTSAPTLLCSPPLTRHHDRHLDAPAPRADLHQQQHAGAAGVAHVHHAVEVRVLFARRAEGGGRVRGSVQARVPCCAQDSDPKPRPTAHVAQCTAPHTPHHTALHTAPHPPPPTPPCARCGAACW